MTTLNSVKVESSNVKGFYQLSNYQRYKAEIISLIEVHNSYSMERPDSGFSTM